METVNIRLNGITRHNLCASMLY